jgi:tetratricopeptide (TPR) repeat protein
MLGHPIGMRLASVVLALCSASVSISADPPKTPAEVSDARRAGLQLAQLVLAQLENDEQKQYPGIQLWLKDVRKATRGMNPEMPAGNWPSLNADELLARNPNFWQAYYEIAPGDPGLMVVHAGLLMTGGEMTRASHVLAVALQRPGIPAPFREAMIDLLAKTIGAGKSSNALVNEGIKLHDRGEYAAALLKYDEALAAWPQNGFAHYEIGYTIYAQALVAAGEKPPTPGNVIVNGKRELPVKTLAAYAKARQHDPLQFMAYQGGDPAVIDGFRALAGRGLPVWQKLVKSPESQIDDAALKDLAEACQDAGIHELGLVVRQVMVARRGRYSPPDHPYFTTGLRKLAPGGQTDALLERLATGVLKVRQVVVPEPEKREFELNQLRLYVPVSEMPRRVGNDVEPFANYVKSLEDQIQRWLKVDKPQAKGLLIAVGIKPGKKSRVWSQAVEGEIPAAALRRLEDGLSKVATIELKKEPVAFGLEILIGGRKVGQFPEFPTVWIDAAKQSGIKVISPPDELFKRIWAD